MSRKTRITILTSTLWNKRIMRIRKDLSEMSKGCNQKFAVHLITESETGIILCKVCGISLKDCIGKEIVAHKNSKRTSYYHIECARKKNILID